MTKKEKILVGISGGVDSSAAIYLLQQQGFDPIGITLKVIENTRESKFNGELQRTQELCKKLAIPHIVKHVEQEFYNKIILNFVDTYLAGETPNPCVICNKLIKWRFLLSEADKRNIKYVATGHYVRIIENNGLFELHKGVDDKKDQSYMLWQLGQSELSRTIFPLGEYKKEMVKDLAKKQSLVPASLSESQDICFIPHNDYRHYLQENFADKFDHIGKGEMVDSNGAVLGYHDGFYNFTIGQRKGFKIGFNERKYVKNLDAKNNRIVITNNDELYAAGMVVQNINFPSETMTKQLAGEIKIRYNSKAVSGTGEMIDNTSAKFIFNTPQRAVTPGQTAVMYHGDKVILGGIIKQIL